MASQKTTSALSVTNVFNAVTSNSRQIFIIFAAFVVAGTLFFAHRQWIISREQAAQNDFSVLMNEFDKISREKDPQWSQLLEKFEANMSKHSSSSLLPYYNSYKVKILLKQGDSAAALATLDTMIADMKSSHYVPLYEMERALVQLSSSDDALKERGLQSLKKLAENTHNMFRDSAQFYLGRYYWSRGETDAARVVWQQLVDDQRDEKAAPSPWASQVQEQLKLLIV